ncbi:MAG: transposase [Candidatus Tectomicrobia bacterium]|nr:transposase [Candidatus Tectomicrobia bacterium]
MHWPHGSSLKREAPFSNQSCFHCEPAGTGDEVLTSLAPSIRRMALTTNRLETREDGQVTVRIKDSATREGTRRTLPAEACLRRFLQPGLPKGFTNVRDDGFLSPTCRGSLHQIRRILEASLDTSPYLTPGKPGNLLIHIPRRKKNRAAGSAGGHSFSCFGYRLPRGPHPDEHQLPECLGKCLPKRRARPGWHSLTEDL